MTVGDRVQYTIAYSNLAPGNSNATNFAINDALPSQLTFVSATITAQTTGNTITLNPGYSGTGALTNTGTLRVGKTLTITVTATISGTNSGNPISNQANATFNTPDNHATVGTVLTDADSAGATTNPPAVGGSFFSNVERWRCKSLVKNFERTLVHATTKLNLCFVRLMLKRLAATS